MQVGKNYRLAKELAKSMRSASTCAQLASQVHMAMGMSSTSFRSYRFLAAFLLASGSLLTGCATEDGETLSVSCDGKCDGLDSVRSLVSDWKKLDLGDIVSIGAGFATDALNDQLTAANYGSLKLNATSLYSTPDVAASDLTIGDLNELVAGLASRYGETSLTTESNRVRAAALTSGAGKIYAESAFKIAASYNPQWNLATRGFGSDGTLAATLGFTVGGELEARVVSLHQSEIRAQLNSPLVAIRAARGFLFPRSSADLKAMKAGESFSLSGQGRLGINLGAGVPILLANPARVIGYELVLSAALRSQIEGQLDVSAIKLDGDQLVVDVGVLKSKVASASVALTGGFGVHGLVQKTVSIGGFSLDLGKLLDKALTSQLNSKFKLLEASAGIAKSATRMSVARVRFALNGADATGAREQAIAQALRGDIRLAQALAARGDAGVIADFDLLRSGVSTTSNAGIEMLGMKFFTEKSQQEGEAVLQTPGGVLALLWNTLHRASGWFFTSHGMSRTGLAGVMFDARKAGPARGEANLLLSTVEGDKYLERDKAIDQFDSVIVALGGRNALRALETKGNQLANFVAAQCPVVSGEYFDEACNINLIDNNSQVQALRNGALADLDAAITGLPAATRDLVHQVADLRLAAQSIVDPIASAVGPSASIVVDFRLDDGALREMFGKDKVAFSAAVQSLMQATQVDRSGDVNAQRADITNKVKATSDKLGEIFATYGSSYKKLVEVEGAEIEGLGKIGANAIEIRFAIDGSNRVDYEKAVARSVAQARSETVTAMYDALLDAAKAMPKTGDRSTAHAEQIAAFALLSMTNAGRTDVRVNLQTDNDSCGLCGSRERYNRAGFVNFDKFAHGPQASLIGAGMFDINSILATE